MIQLDLPAKILRCGNTHLDLCQPQIMGILNVTPDSFSDGGCFNGVDRAVAQALLMREQGASIVDIGGESTRPHAAAVTLQQELDRVIPVVEALAGQGLILSIDTSSPEVICAAVAKGAHIWNDVRALSRKNALQTAAELAIPVVLMHMRGEPSTMNQLAVYKQLMPEIMYELQQRIDAAMAVGVPADNIIVDAGFGFAKNTAQNVQLLANFEQLQNLGYPILAGLSRKRFIGDILQQPDAAARDSASAAAHLLCVQKGAQIIRTHNVVAMRQTLDVWQAVQLSAVN